MQQALDIRKDGQPVDHAVMRVDEHQLAGKPGAAQVARDHRADGAGPRGYADQRYRSRFEQFVEVTNRHWRLAAAPTPGQSKGSPPGRPAG